MVLTGFPVTGLPAIITNIGYPATGHNITLPYICEGDRSLERSPFFYSLRKDSTGFALAARIAWKLTVNSAIAIAARPATA